MLRRLFMYVGVFCFLFALVLSLHLFIDRCFLSQRHYHLFWLDNSKVTILSLNSVLGVSGLHGHYFILKVESQEWSLRIRLVCLGQTFHMFSLPKVKVNMNVISNVAIVTPPHINWTREKTCIWSAVSVLWLICRWHHCSTNHSL